jgi:hypothetical protein
VADEMISVEFSRLTQQDNGLKIHTTRLQTKTQIAHKTAKIANP